MFLFRPRNTSTSSSGNTNDGCDPIFCSSDKKLKKATTVAAYADADDDVPGIQAVASYDSASTTASGSSNTSITTTPRSRTIAALQVDVPPSYEQEEQLLAAETTVQASSTLSSPDSSSENSASPTSYFSRDELETLVTPRFMEDLEAAVIVHSADSDDDDTQRERQQRKELIQRELVALIQAAEAEADMDEDDNRREFEPEAVEALGVAANRVAYQQRYYDVPSGQYIYVPSIAYTILNGTLLEEASKHYFGKNKSGDDENEDENEFLIAYAASLGNAILQNQQPHVLQIRTGKETNEDDALSVVDFLSPRSPTVIPNNDVALFANSCFGVSPTSRECFPFESSPSSSSAAHKTATPSLTTPSSKRQYKVLALIGLNFLLLACMTVMTLVWGTTTLPAALSPLAATADSAFANKAAASLPFWMDDGVFHTLLLGSDADNVDAATSTRSSTYTAGPEFKNKLEPARETTPPSTTNSQHAKPQAKTRAIVANLLY
jgi:hypothetical protein